MNGCTSTRQNGNGIKYICSMNIVYEKSSMHTVTVDEYFCAQILPNASIFIFMLIKNEVIVRYWGKFFHLHFSKLDFGLTACNLHKLLPSYICNSNLQFFLKNIMTSLLHDDMCASLHIEYRKQRTCHLQVSVCRSTFTNVSSDFCEIRRHTF